MTEDKNTASPEQSKPSPFSEAATAFLRNMSSLRILASRMGDLADSHDRTTNSEFSACLVEMVPSLAKLIVLGETNETEKEPSAPSTGDETAGDTKSLEGAVEQELHVVFDDHEKREKFLKQVVKYGREAPVQGALLRKGALVTLVSAFEGLIAGLVHAYYERFPNALSPDGKSLSLADLRRIGSIPEAEKFIVSREVEDILRKSLDDQVSYLAKRGLDVSSVSAFRERLVEIGERRNIHVHNQARANHYYLANVTSELVKEYSVTDGKTLHVSGKYLAQSMDVVEIVGTILVQIAWRKWHKETASEADDALIDIVFEALKEGRHSFVCAIATFVNSIDMAEDLTSRVICVNHAIALRDSGAAAAVIDTTLSQHDWSAASLKFQVALSAVRNEREKFEKLLRPALASEEVKTEHLRDWPLYGNWRGQAWFDELVAGLETPN